MLKTYYHTILRLGFPLTYAGVFSYAAGMVEVILLGRLSLALLGVLALSTMFISLIMSGMMSLVTANQSAFARLISRKRDRSMLSEFFFCSILTSAVIAVSVFLCFRMVLFFIAFHYPASDTGNMSLILDYLNIASFSMLLVPVLFSIKGTLNGRGLTHLSFRISAMENVIRIALLTIFLGLLRDCVIADNSLIRLPAYALLGGEIIGVLYALVIIWFHDVSLLKLKVKFSTFILYWRKVRSIIGVSAVYNMVGACSLLYFMSKIGDLSMVYLGIFRIILTAFNFNRLIFSGITQANGIYSAQIISHKVEKSAQTIRENTYHTLLFSSLFSIIIAGISIAILLKTQTLDFSFVIVLAFIFEGMSLVLYHVLVHCRFEKAISMIGALLHILCLMILPTVWAWTTMQLGIIFLLFEIIILLFYITKYRQFISNVSSA
ncbi:MATE family efflux transporter [Fastidiosibacter lacustris]|uniref:MATE family efflux transporter n=1 Tax=Fastidiosibacter lacustris TaxID=2056695 RepID=UPI000E347A7B|nr:MATE family efflux transporter [Fastidiosibacter lacustris]